MERYVIEERMKKEPFRPFHVVMSSGDRYEVRHPELAMVLKTRVIVALPSGNGDNVPDRTVDCAMDHITGIEDLQPAR